MAELLIRVGAQDVALTQRVLTGPAGQRPSRVVVDAHVAKSAPAIATAAAIAGVPFLIDPQTHYFQGTQHIGDPWAQLPFADRTLNSPDDLLRHGRANAVAEEVIDYQLAHDASALIAPYVHIQSASDGWLQVQLALWRATRRVLNEQGVQLPLVSVVALGWRLLDRSTWPETLRPLRDELALLAPSEIAIAASKVDQGVRPDQRLAALIAVIGHFACDYPVIAWQQGALGEAAVAAGASAYETGVGWRERCDLRSSLAAHIRPPAPGGTARPVYVDAVKRGVDKRLIRALMNNPKIAASLTCLDSDCCPGGRLDLLGDPRQHAITARLRSLSELTQPAHPAWRWNHLAEGARHGIELASRINRYTAGAAGVPRLSVDALQATLVIAEHRRQTLRRRSAA